MKELKLIKNSLVPKKKLFNTFITNRLDYPIYPTFNPIFTKLPLRDVTRVLRTKHVGTHIFTHDSLLIYEFATRAILT